MYEQKRWFHIRRAEERLEAGNGVRAEGGTGFAYDKERLYDALVRSTDDYIYICDMRTNTFRYPPAMVEEFRTARRGGPQCRGGMGVPCA